MVFGGIDKEVIALNESTVWSGSPNAGSVSPSGREYLGEMRRLLFAGKYAEANALCAKHLAGREDSYGTHLPMANLLIDRTAAASGPVTDYKRWLDLETALAGVQHSSGGIQWSTEVFASNPGNVVAIRIAANRPAQVSLAVTLDPGDLPGEVRARDDRTLVLMGSAWEMKHSDGHIGVSFQASARVVPEGGSVAANGTRLEVQNADAVVLLVAANTSYRGADFPGLCEQHIESASKKRYQDLRVQHIADHRRLFRRVGIDLGGSEAARRPTDQRLAAVRSGGDDPQLSALFFQYGRYLLIAGSREDSRCRPTCKASGTTTSPAIWAGRATSISTSTRSRITGRARSATCPSVTSRCSGWWSLSPGTAGRRGGCMARAGGCATSFPIPGALPAGSWGVVGSLTGGIWIASHLWEHYLFTGDKAFLAQRAYPVLKRRRSSFSITWWSIRDSRWLVTGPSISPRTSSWRRTARGAAIRWGRPAIASWSLTCSPRASTARKPRNGCGVPRAVGGRAGRLAPLQVGKHGQLQEWLEDFDEAEPNHRHTSHLIGLYPLDQITPDQTPDLARAARVTLERRTQQKNWEDVEWSRANLVNFCARLQDGEGAHKHLLGLLREDTDHNLLTFSRAGIAGAQENIFAIDGNTAGTAGVAEMLLQSHHDIHLLPALPGAWPSGSVTGLRARGGYEVDIVWRGGALASAVVRSSSGGTRKVRYRDSVVPIELTPGGSVRLDGRLKLTHG